MAEGLVPAVTGGGLVRAVKEKYTHGWPVLLTLVDQCTRGLSVNDNQALHLFQANIKSLSLFMSIK